MHTCMPQPMYTCINTQTNVKTYYFRGVNTNTVQPNTGEEDCETLNDLTVLIH